MYIKKTRWGIGQCREEHHHMLRTCLFVPNWGGHLAGRVLITLARSQVKGNPCQEKLSFCRRWFGEFFGGNSKWNLFTPVDIRRWDRVILAFTGQGPPLSSVTDSTDNLTTLKDRCNSGLTWAASHVIYHRTPQPTLQPSRTGVTVALRELRHTLYAKQGSFSPLQVPVFGKIPRPVLFYFSWKKEGRPNKK